MNFKDKAKKVLKREAGYIGKGAKAVGGVARGAVSSYVADVREQAKANRAAADKAKKVEQAAYARQIEVELTTGAEQRGIDRAKKAVAGRGSTARNIVNDLGVIGLRLENNDTAGIGKRAKGQASGVGNYLLDGVGVIGGGNPFEGMPRSSNMGTPVIMEGFPTIRQKNTKVIHVHHHHRPRNRNRNRHHHR